MAVMGTRGIRTFSRPLRYRNQTVTLPDGTPTVTLVGQEKGADVRIALDIVRFGRCFRSSFTLPCENQQDSPALPQGSGGLLVAPSDEAWMSNK